MGRRVFHFSKEFAPMAEVCTKALYDQQKIELDLRVPPLGDDWAVFNADANSAIIAQLASCGLNVYVIWTRAKDSERWEPKYSGKTMLERAEERLTAHLLGGNDHIRSQLKNVQKAVSAGCTMGLTTIKVIPDALMASIEEATIDYLLDRGAELWNRHHAKKKKKKPLRRVIRKKRAGESTQEQ